MNYQELLNSEYVIDTYKKIEYLKKDFPVNHGFIHINHVIDNAKRISKVFNFSKEDTELLLIAAVLHDIGYTVGRDEHAKNGRLLALEYLMNHSDIEQKNIKRICNAIASHGGKEKKDYRDNISIALILADKMDFVKSRYDEKECQWLDKYKVFLTIENVSIERQDDTYGIIIKSTDADFEKHFCERSIYKKLLDIVNNINNYTNYNIKIEFDKTDTIDKHI